MDPQLYELATLGIAAGTAILTVRYASHVIVTRIKAAPKVKTGDKFQGLSAMVANVDDILAQLYKMRDEMQKTTPGITSEQLKPLEDRIKWMEKIKDNRQWLQYVAPYADDLLGSGLKMLQKWMK